MEFNSKTLIFSLKYGTVTSADTTTACVLFNPLRGTIIKYILGRIPIATPEGMAFIILGGI